MDEIAPDIKKRLSEDFGPKEFERRLQQLAESTECPRVQRCIVFAARGHAWYFDYLCRLAKFDYRDVIIAAEYERLGAHLYNFNLPIDQAGIADPYADGSQNETKSR